MGHIINTFTKTLLILLTIPGQAFADTNKEVPEAPLSSRTYSLPFLLRGISPTNSIRLESVYSFYETNPTKDQGFIQLYTLSASKKISESLAIFIKQAIAHNNPSGTYKSAHILSNPAIGLLKSITLSEKTKLAFSLTNTIPLGSGKGNTPNSNARFANTIAQLSRSAMENSLYASNYTAIIPGIDLALLEKNYSVQFEANLFQLIRIDGEKVDKDKYRTNLTLGLSSGIKLSNALNFIGELRYQRWLNNDAVEKTANPAIDNLTLGIGPRFNFKLSTLTIKPAISYSQALYGAIAKTNRSSASGNYKTITLDLPIIF